MAKETYTITLADGTVLKGLSRNGNVFTSKSEIKGDFSDTNLATVTIAGPQGSGWNPGTYTNLRLARLWQDEGLYWLAFRELSPIEVTLAGMQKSIDDLTISALN